MSRSSTSLIVRTTLWQSTTTAAMHFLTLSWWTLVGAFVAFADALHIPFLPQTTNTSTNVKEDNLHCTAAASNNSRVAYIFFNPAAGGGSTAQEEIDTIQHILEPEISVKIIHTDKHHPEKQCRKFVKKLLRQSSQQQQQHPSTTNSIVVAAGGDGTVSAVARALIHTGLPLGVIPRGTANAFATALGIPTSSLEAACENLTRGPPSKSRRSSVRR